MADYIMLRTAHGGSRMNKLSLNQLTQAHVDRLYNALYALADMVLQFGCETTFRRKRRYVIQVYQHWNLRFLH